jgi:hypothetical protein
MPSQPLACWGGTVTTDVCRLNLAPPQQMYDRLVAGGIAGAVSRTMVAPLERYVVLKPCAA